MPLFEKIFQRNDKFFLQLYFFTLGFFFFLSSIAGYYLRTGTYQLPETYVTGTILLTIIFWISGLIKLKENSYIINAKPRKTNWFYFFGEIYENIKH